MQTWESIWMEMISSDLIKEEYKKAFLLNLFQKLIAKMNANDEFKVHILNLYRQTKDTVAMTKTIYSKEFDYNLDESETEMLTEWMIAYRRKQPKRKSISKELKIQLCEKQNYKCSICNQTFNNDLSKVHVDHIIPWILVGDELKNNYQALCETCNECKSSKTDYIFKSLLKII